jgi:hypothetical protein
MKTCLTLLAITLSIALSSPAAHAAEALELGAKNYAADRIGGKEADSIIGDFVLRNDKVEAVISGNLPLRRANMSTFYGADGITPGCLYDLSLRDTDNDQIVAFCPLNQRGQVNHVRILEAGGDGKPASIEVFTSAAKTGGIEIRHVYQLSDGDAGVLITSTVTNRSKEAITRDNFGDVNAKFRVRGAWNGIDYVDAIDPADKCGYAWAFEPDTKAPKRSQPFAPGASITVARFIAVGTSPAAALGEVAQRHAPVGTLQGAMLDDEGKGIGSGRVMIAIGNSKFPAYPDDAGKISVKLPVGDHQLSIEDIGRPSVEQRIKIAPAKPTALNAKMGKAAQVIFKITDEAGKDIPCKAQFNPIEGTEKPNLGPTDRAHGCVDQYHSETGSFTVQLPPGSYEVIVTRGPEFGHLKQTIKLTAGGAHNFEGKLIRQVDTRGWVSTDYHNHSTPSGDNTCGTDDRVINLAAEHIEYAPTTEHNRLYDWAPHIDKLGLKAHISTIPGLELTGSGAHFNMFPLTPKPGEQDGGAPVWSKDPRLNAIVLRGFQGERADRWIHVNHPDMVENFIDRNGDGKADGGFAYFGNLIDGLEAQNYRNSEILAGAPYELSDPFARGGRIKYIREFIWLQLLNQGLPARAIAVSDAHHVHGNGVGGWRTYVKSSTDDPAKINWQELSRNSKAGRMILSSGPYLEVKTAGGIEAGGHDRANGKLGLKVKVQCADWLDIDRVQVLVNGRQPEDYNYTRKKNPAMFGSADEVVKFDQNLSLDLSEDAHIIVVAIGENHTLKTGFGSSSQSNNRPVAYNNPIFIDVDGNGFEPNYDTLGFDLPVKGLTPDEVRKALNLEAPVEEKK